MSATVFDSAVSLASTDGLDWLDGKFKVYLVDMEDAGPSAGAWKISSISTGALSGGYADVTVTTSAAHGLAVGNKIAIFGNVGPPRTWLTNTMYPPDSFVRPTSPNGRRFKNMETGFGSSGSTQPTWTAGSRVYQNDSGATWYNEGTDTNSPVNGIRTVDVVPSTTTFTLAAFPNAPSTFTSYGYIANLSKTYLSEFVPSGGRVGVSDALTGKTVQANGALDCTDPYITVPSPADPSEVMLLVKTAALDADPDLADTAQRLIAYTDSASPLPLPANPGSVLLSVSNGTDRLMRL